MLKEKERMKKLDDERIQEELRQREETESAKMGARLEKFKELKHRTMARMQAATRRAKEEEEQQVTPLPLTIDNIYPQTDLSIPSTGEETPFLDLPSH